MDAEAYADMLPWLVFVVMDRKLGLGVAWAGGAAVACSAGLMAWSYWRGRYALLPRIAIGVFAVCLVSGLVFPAWNHQVSLPRALVIVTLSVVAFGSLRFTPMSEIYTLPLVAPAIRGDPRFRKVNVEMTMAWGVGTFAVALACSTTALLSGQVAFTLLDWVTPLVLATITILWAARRWELFRLAVDSAPVDHHGPDVSLQVHAGARDVAGTPSRPAWASRGFTPLGQSTRDTEPARDGRRDAVVRQLPVRRRDLGAARGE